MTTDFSTFKRFDPPGPAAGILAKDAAGSIAQAMANGGGSVRSIDVDDLSRLDSDMQAAIVDVFMKERGEA